VLIQIYYNVNQFFRIISMFVNKQQCNYRAMNVGLYCIMSVVFNAVTASQLKHVNNFIFTDIVT